MIREDIGMNYQEVYNAFQNDFQRTPKKNTLCLKNKISSTRSAYTNSAGSKSNSKFCRANDEDLESELATTASSGKISQYFGLSARRNDQFSVRQQDLQQYISNSTNCSEEDKISPYESTNKNILYYLRSNNHTNEQSTELFKFKFEANLENIIFKYDNLHSQLGEKGIQELAEDKESQGISEGEENTEFEEEKNEINNIHESSSSSSSSAEEEDDDKENRDPDSNSQNYIASPVGYFSQSTPLQSRDHEQQGTLSQRNGGVIRFKPLLETIYDTASQMGETKEKNSDCEFEDNNNRCAFNSSENNIFLQKRQQSYSSQQNTSYINELYQQHLLQNSSSQGLKFNYTNNSSQKRTPLRDITTSQISQRKKNICGVKKMLEFNFSPMGKKKIEENSIFVKSNKIFPAILCR